MVDFFQDITFPSLYICNVNSGRKSILHPLFQNDLEETIVMDEYYYGYTANNISKDFRQTTIEEFEYKMKSFHNWTNEYPLFWFVAHECSEMIISIGKFFFVFNTINLL